MKDTTQGKEAKHHEPDELTSDLLTEENGNESAEYDTPRNSPTYSMEGGPRKTEYGLVILGVFVGFILNIVVVFSAMAITGSIFKNNLAFILPLLMTLAVDYFVWWSARTSNRSFASGFIVGTVALLLLFGGCLGFFMVAVSPI